MISLVEIRTDKENEILNIDIFIRLNISIKKLYLVLIFFCLKDYYMKNSE